MASRVEILAEAARIIAQDRNATHGEPENTFPMIAASWSAKLGITVTPAQVCLLLADLKACRAWGNPGHADNWVDGAGYNACGGELASAAATEAADRQAVADELIARTMNRHG